MRLVCPNCEAKYEVPEDAIPETGRDVQCANCGHAWYQMRPRAAVAETVAAAPVVAPPVAKAPEPPPAPEPKPVPEPELVAEPEPLEPELEVKPEVAVPDLLATAPEVTAEPVADPIVETAAEPEPIVETVVEPVAAVVEPVTVTAVPEPVAAAEASAPLPDLEEDDDTLAYAPAPAAAAAPAAYAVDESVLAILREEAEREAQARKAESAKALEMQPDLGILAAAPVIKKAVEVISADARSPTAAEDGEDKLAGRKTRLPDVEEINSTLRPDEQLVGDSQDDLVVTAGEGRSSFRSGFLLVMTVAILGAALYISADALAQAVPSLAGVLKSYVGMVDGLRLQLDGLMQGATVAINGNGP